MTDLLAQWALLEIDDIEDMTYTFTQLPDTVSKNQDASRKYNFEVA